MKYNFFLSEFIKCKNGVGITKIKTGKFMVEGWPRL